MAAGDKVGTTKCDCGGTVIWTENKTGGASGSCASCGEQRFKRSPRAIEGLKVAIAAGASSSPAPADDGDFLKKL